MLYRLSYMGVAQPQRLLEALTPSPWPSPKRERGNGKPSAGEGNRLDLLADQLPGLGHDLLQRASQEL
jgi:hypothetical protein